jgi:hypothetical protein
MKKYAYAIMDGNEAPDQYRTPESCHSTIEAARKERDRLNRKNANNHYYIIDWNAGRWDKEPPADGHHGAIE